MRSCKAVAKELNWSRTQLTTEPSTNWTGLEPFLERLVGLSCPHRQFEVSTDIYCMCGCMSSQISVNLVYDYVLNEFVLLHLCCSFISTWCRMVLASGCNWVPMAANVTEIAVLRRSPHLNPPTPRHAPKFCDIL